MNDPSPIRPFHRLTGVLVAVPLLIWISTGLLFHVKHRYGEAYEQLQVPAAAARWDRVGVSPAQLVREGKLDPGGRLSLAVHPSGAMVYQGLSKGRRVSIDGSTGRPLQPASPETGKEWVEAAVKNAPHARRYDSALRHERTGDHAVTVFFRGGKEVRVDLLTGELSQQGALNKWIDLTYRLHYLQWTPWQSVNIALVIAAALAVLALTASGIKMAVLHFLS